VRACIPNGRAKWFHHSILSSCGRRAKRAGYERMRSRNICFGHVPIVVCQGRLCRDAAAAGEEQLGRAAADQSKYNRLYLNSGKSALAAMYLRRIRVIGRCFAAALTHVSRAPTPPAPAAQYLGVGLWRPCRGQTCGGVLGVMARNAPARPVASRSTTTCSPLCA
jgi:hypothetical protein